MRHNTNPRPHDRYPLHEAVIDVLETYVGTWWTADAIASRLAANPHSVRKAIQRMTLPANIFSRRNPDTAGLEYQATCRSYLHDEVAA